MIKNFILRLDRKIYNGITGKRATPPEYEIKRRTMEEYADRFGTKIFVETGTYLGETIEAMKNRFAKLFSIEIDQNLFNKVSEKFKSCPRIDIRRGDSATVLPSIVETLAEPAMFWLDGHYSGGLSSKGELNTPILKELDIILRHKIKNHVILIDDARCFIGENDYPTLRDLAVFVSGINDNFNFEVENDIVRISPAQNPKNRPSTYREPFRRQAGEKYRRVRNFFTRLAAKNI